MFLRIRRKLRRIFDRVLPAAVNASVQQAGLQRIAQQQDAQQVELTHLAQVVAEQSSKQGRNWEEFITLHSDVEPVRTLLGPARDYHDGDDRRDEWSDLDYKDALAKDDVPLPSTEEREGYYGPYHFSYWASGFHDAHHLMEAAKRHTNKPIASYLDLGCASGRVLRHIARDLPDCEAIGCDINRLHVEWCNAHLPANARAFQNHSVPSLPLEDNSLDLVSAFSVFTHIEALETAWLSEIRRVLKPGGIAWITVHTENTLLNMDEAWPIWDPVMKHPDAQTKLDEKRNFDTDRLTIRWHADRSYSSNVFYQSDYIRSRWGRILDIVEEKPLFPHFQDVFIMRKPED